MKKIMLIACSVALIGWLVGQAAWGETDVATASFYMRSEASIIPHPEVEGPSLSFGFVETPSTEVVVVIGHDGGTAGTTAGLMGGQNPGTYLISGDPAYPGSVINVSVTPLGCSDAGLTMFTPTGDVSTITGSGTLRVGASLKIAPGTPSGSCTYSIAADYQP